jgi:hypothetical protein
VTLSVFDMLGRRIATLVNEVKEAGQHSINWNAAGVASGLYFYRLLSGTRVAVKKRALMK